ncbi:MAG: hypothetical protein RL154_1114 [Pseudomonadota bacterium]|jgi:peptidoglycan/LPS O-acetylase OafA/YrhL
MRFEAIDGLRALAALIVAFGHAYRTGILGNALDPILHTPLAIFIAGDAAVLLFFVMSGFFIALPYAKGKSKGYFDFLSKRFFRIYIPYIAAVFAAVIAFELFARPSGIPQMSAWFNVLWQTPPTIEMVLAHVLMLGEFDANIYDPVLWAMVIEIRVAFIAPFLVLFVARFGAFAGISISLIISYCAFWASIHFGLSEIATAHWRTLTLLPPFLIGMSLAYHREEVLLWVKNLNSIAAFFILMLAISLMPCAYWLGVGIATFAHYTILSFSAAIIVIFAMNNGLFYKIISIKPLQFIGKISYTFYLWHFIILLSLIYALFGTIANEYIFIIWVLMTVPVSWLAYKLIEEPSSKLKLK